MMRVPQVLGAIAAAMTLASAVACSGGGGQTPAARQAQAQTPVAAALAVVGVTQPSREPIEAEIEAPGTFMAADEAAVAAEVTGPVVQVLIEEGSRVAEGAPVVRLDSSKAELGVRQAEAAVAQARAGFEKAKSDLTRKQSLLDDKTIAPGTFDAFKAQYDGAVAGVAAADSALALARRRLTDCVVRAPFAGVVKDRRVSKGQYVRDGDSLFVLMRIDPLKLRFDVPEKYADRVALGQTVRATVVALPGQTVTGRIQTIFPSVAVDSRTIRLEARVPNPGYRLKPGYYGSVRVPMRALDQSLAVPVSALVRREGMDYVFVVRGEKAELVRVVTGLEGDGRVELISGVGASDRVVVEGAAALGPGDRVQVKG